MEKKLNLAPERPKRSNIKSKEDLQINHHSITDCDKAYLSRIYTMLHRPHNQPTSPRLNMTAIERPTYHQEVVGNEGQSGAFNLFHIQSPDYINMVPYSFPNSFNAEDTGSTGPYPTETEVTEGQGQPASHTKRLKMSHTEHYASDDEESSTGGRGCNRWTEREEVFLSGIVMDVYYRRHSLKPTNVEKTKAKESGSSCDMLVWQQIGARYNTARERFLELTGRRTSERSIKSLQRHWKETGFKTKLTTDEENEEMPVTKKRERKWDDVYNLHYFLSCTDEMFEKMKQDEKKVGAYKARHLKKHSQSH